ncbi:unnamed protein product [Camellia sinensis]
MGGDDTLLSPENPCTGRKRLILEELINGRDLATQLQILLQNPSADHGSVSVEEIGVKILRSFTDTLSVLMSCNDSGEVCQIPASTLSSGDQTSVDSGESSKRLPPLKDRRGCYKRRKILDSWTEVSPSTEDGHAWRKYGQKEILNAKFPRNYFRCTHKVARGCRATKQVQRIQEDPNMYQTTYFGHHTCRATITLVDPLQNISDSDHPLDSCLINFESKSPIEQYHHLSRSQFASINEESKELETQSDRLSENVSSLDSVVVWPELMTGSHGLDMELFMNPVDFDSYFHFDESEFI